MSDGLVTASDTERRRTGLEAWFTARGLDGATVTLHPGPQATGASHETIVFDVHHDNGKQALVARVEPGTRPVFPEPDLSVEYRLIDSLARTDIPLPRLLAFESGADLLGAPFYVMERVEGTVAGDSPPYTTTGWLHEAEPALRERVWFAGLQAMARVHNVECRDLEFVNCGRPIGLAGELEYWGDYRSFAASDGLHDGATRAWDWLVANTPSNTSVGLCWGDSRLGNQLFDGGRCVALLDWEMAALSDPTQDLAWFVYFDDVFTDGIGVPHLEGFPPRDVTIARYEELTGRRVRNFDWFYVFAAYRFVAIMHRIGVVMIADGRMPAGSVFARDNFASAHLARLCDEKGIP